jgi:hypothetical protein
MYGSLRGICEISLYKMILGLILLEYCTDVVRTSLDLNKWYQSQHNNTM